MGRKRPRELALGGVAVLLIAVAAWTMQRGTAPPSVAKPSGTSPANKTQTPQKNAMIEVDLKSLEAERAEPEENTRNPFRFRTRPAPQPSAEVVRQQQEQAAAAAQAATGPIESPPPPPIPLKYIGDVQDPKNPGKKIAILSDSRGTYHGREGQVVEGRYRILRIGVESIELAYLDGRGRQTIRQTGQ